MFAFGLMEVHYRVYKYGGITAKFATLPGRDREAVDLRLVVTSMRLGFFFHLETVYQVGWFFNYQEGKFNLIPVRVKWSASDIFEMNLFARGLHLQNKIRCPVGVLHIRLF
jgi:hypothetical protein